MELPTAQQRRFLGVRGVNHARLHAHVLFHGFPFAQLDLVVAPAHLMPNSTAVRAEHALNAQAAITNAEEDIDLVQDGVAQPAVRVENITVPQLQALGFATPVTLDGALTGVEATIPVGIHDEVESIVFGQYVSADGSGSAASMHVIVTAGAGLAPLHVPYMRVERAMELLEAHGYLPLEPAIPPPPEPPAPPPQPEAPLPEGIPVQQGNVHVHWADEGGYGPAQHPPAGGAMPPPAMPVPIPPVQVAPPVPPLGAAPPWRGLEAATPMLDHLLAQLTPAMLVDLGQIDALVRTVAPESGAPADAFQPPGDVLARFSYLEEAFARLLAEAGIVAIPPLRAPGWRGVFDCARVLKRSVRQAVPAPPPPAPGPVIPPTRDASWSQLADRHRLAQAGAGSSSAAPLAPLDPSRATALQAAGVAIDQEGLPSATSTPIYDGLQAALRVTPTSSLAAVRDLGSRMANFAPSLQVLESGDGANYAATSSAHMTCVSMSLKTLSLSFVIEGAKRLREFIGVEDDLLSADRTSALQQCVKNLFRGKPLMLSELLLSGRGADSIVQSLTEAGHLRWHVVMEWIGFAVQLFDPASAHEEGFFGYARRLVNEQHEQNHVSFEVLSTFLNHRLLAIQQAFHQFYTGQLLVRPRYSAEWLSSDEAGKVLERIKTRRLDQVLADAEARAKAVADAAGSSMTPAEKTALEAQQLKEAEKTAEKSAARKRKREASKLRKAAEKAATPLGAAAPAPAPAGTTRQFLDTIGPRHVGPPAPNEMAAFSAANVDANGKGLCFNRWRKGFCARGDDCLFSHLPKA
jgi:hypothetical protein